MISFKKWLEATEDEFMAHHRTGSISDSAYADYEKEGGLSWLGPPEKGHPVLIGTKKYGPYTVDFRQSGEKLQYVAHDEEGDMKRDDKGLVVYMTDDEIKKEGLATHDKTIVAYVGDKPIGFVSNEWGAVGVWVEGPYQKLGIGSDLLVMYMEKNPRLLRGESRLGQMTYAGDRASRTAYKKLVAKHGDEAIKVPD